MFIDEANIMFHPRLNRRHNIVSFGLAMIQEPGPAQRGPLLI